MKPKMRLAMVCTPPTDHHLRWAAQIGVDDFVARYPAIETADKLACECKRVAEVGLKLSVVEGYLPFADIVHGGPGRDAQINNVKRLIREMGRQGVEILCYNFMPHNDWTRTSMLIVTRGGAMTNEFDLAALADRTVPRGISSEVLWENLAHFLREVIPVAEDSNVKLAMHPDDPPLPKLLGFAQVMNSREDFVRLFELEKSPANGMCLCTGSLAAAGQDVPGLARLFSGRIAYVHFRNLRGTVPHFSEPFHDDGDLDMAAVMRALRSIHFTGPMRPDHVPKLDGEEGQGDGYTMLGRLFAAGYIRGLMHATEDNEH